MPYTFAGRNLMLNALKGTNPATPITHCGLLTAGAAITGVTGVTSTDTFTKTAHGLSNGDLVVLSEMTGGSGLVAGDVGNANGLARSYYVIGVTANTFQLSNTSGGAAADLGTDISAVKVTKLTEVTGGSPAYARKAIAFNAAAEATMDDSTNGAVFDIPAGGVVDYVGFYSAITAGTILAFDKVTQETFSGQGTYTLNDADLDLLMG